jgi:hypothetical protein
MKKNFNDVNFFQKGWIGFIISPRIKNFRAIHLPSPELSVSLGFRSPLLSTLPKGRASLISAAAKNERGLDFATMVTSLFRSLNISAHTYECELAAYCFLVLFLMISSDYSRKEQKRNL